MDHEVHINNGGREPRPIVFHLLPGEETIFNLKVINHGQPANISLNASSPVFKAVRLKKPDHYVIQEEVIPVLARMPADISRLDGEIILLAGGRENHVPITLLDDSEGPFGPLDHPEDHRLPEDEDAVKDMIKEEEDGEKSGGEDEEEHEPDDEYEPGRRGLHSEDDAGEIEEAEGKHPRRISFSMDADLKRYRSARGRDRQGRGAEGTEEGMENDGEDGRAFIPRYRTRIDDSFVDKSRRQEETGSDRLAAGGMAGNGEGGHEKWRREEEPYASAEEEGETGEEQDGGWEQRSPDREEGRFGYHQEADSESREIIHQAERDELNLLEEGEHESGQGYNDEGRQDDDTGRRSSGYAQLGRTGDLSRTGSIQTVPALILLILIAALVLTFVTGTVPEFPGALASSILIVTLIIYGASRLLKT